MFKKHISSGLLFAALMVFVGSIALWQTPSYSKPFAPCNDRDVVAKLGESRMVTLLTEQEIIDQVALSDIKVDQELLDCITDCIELHGPIIAARRAAVRAAELALANAQRALLQFMNGACGHLQGLAQLQCLDQLEQNPQFQALMNAVNAAQAALAQAQAALAAAEQALADCIMGCINNHGGDCKDLDALAELLDPIEP